MDQTRYNTRGSVGLLTPQANPVAEVEIALLLDPDVSLMVGRMTDDAPAMNDRLKAYARGLQTSLAGFGGAPLDAIGFACTGSSYFDADPKVSALSQAARTFTPTPFVAAADAVCDALANLGAGRIALVSPYPEDLTQSAADYWGHRGLKVTEIRQAPPAAGAHPIYGLTARALHDAMGGLGSDHEAVLLMGTGAPTLPVIAAASGSPVVSANLCLGWRFAGLLAKDAAPSFADFAGPAAPWRRRLAERYPAAMLDARR